MNDVLNQVHPTFFLFYSIKLLQRKTLDFIFIGGYWVLNFVCACVYYVQYIASKCLSIECLGLMSLYGFGGLYSLLLSLDFIIQLLAKIIKNLWCISSSDRGDLHRANCTWEDKFIFFYLYNNEPYSWSDPFSCK